MAEGDSFIFGGNTGLSYEQLKQRRAIAQALASRNQGFPKTKGEGMTYLGQSIAEALGDIGLQRREAEYRARQTATLGTLRSPATTPQQTTVQPPQGQPPVAPVVAPMPPPVVPPPAAAAPAPPPPAVTGDMGPDVGPPIGGAGGPAPDIPMPMPRPAALAGESYDPGAPPTAAVPPPPVPPVSVDPNAAVPLTGGNAPTSQDLSAPRDRIAATMMTQSPADQVTLPTQTADIPLPRGNPRTTGGVRATMEAALSRGGQSPAAIAGIERNVRDESGFNPNLRHPDQPNFSGEAHFAHGLYQEGGDEWNNYVKWIDKNMPGADWRDPNLQSKFLAERLQDPQYTRTNEAMNAPGATPSSAAQAFVGGYLKPADRYLNQRMAQYGREGGNQQYASLDVPEGGGSGRTSYGPRTGSGSEREGGAPVDDTRDLVTQALLEQPQQKPQEDQSTNLLPDVAGMTNRTTLPQRPTAALGRTGVASDVSLGALPPMGALGGSQGTPLGTPAGSPPGSPAPDPREAVTQALLSQQGPGATDLGAGPDANQSPPGPSATMTDIQPAPPMGPTAQAGPPPIPGPLTPPTPRPPTSLQAQPATPSQFAEPPVKPPMPQIPPISAAELRAQDAIARFPDDPVIQQRAQQALADAEKVRLMPYQRDIEQWKADMGVYNQQYGAWQENQRKQPMEDIELRTKRQELSDKEAAAARSTRLGGIPDQVFAAQIEKSADASKGIPGATQAIANARQAIKEGMYTGSAADLELQLGKIARAAGYGSEDTTNKLANTEAFRAYMAGVTAQARQNLVGSNQISNADLIASQQASGGKITMEPESVLKILGTLERINTASAVQHQGKLLAYAGDDPNAQRSVFGTFGLPMENVVPQAAKELLVKNPTPEVQADFDRTFNTPGLAQRILKYR